MCLPPSPSAWGGPWGLSENSVSPFQKSAWKTWFLVSLQKNGPQHEKYSEIFQFFLLILVDLGA